ncbi:hypothetical protein SAMN06265222_12628 [Neorhodopirellula lusitana]|uniref:Uncharacterized protein n=1 Tax=Neorhodopirellula lusitana TaxID=445327 RepID=A0ABY1QUT6_9BACT|nr:hypothetical protein SAMN06265222_12628 [Neorhodopirellula lusitana]
MAPYSSATGVTRTSVGLLVTKRYAGEYQLHDQHEVWKEGGVRMPRSLMLPLCSSLPLICSLDDVVLLSTSRILMRCRGLRTGLATQVNRDTEKNRVGTKTRKSSSPATLFPSVSPSLPRQAFAKGGLTKTSSTCKDVRFDIGHAGSMTRISYIDSKADCFAKPVACHRNP